MELDPEGSVELETESNLFHKDELKDKELLYSRNTSLDQDFNYLLGLALKMSNNIQNEKEKNLCEVWLDRLVVVPSQNATEKRERNVYLLNLLLSIIKGEFLEPFDKLPPIKLKPGVLVFGSNLRREVCYRNMNLEVEDFAEYSRESRTFFAAKALPGGNGAFGYLAVSLGGGDAMWLDCQGNNVDPSKLRKQKPSKPETKENTEIYKALISQRSTEKDRSELLPYYYGVMERMREISNSIDTESEITDPVIDKMIEEFQIEIISEGKIEISEIPCIDKTSWLCALGKKIENLVEAAEQREMTLSHLEKMLVEHDHEKDGITFLDVSNAIKPPKLDPILAEAVSDKPSEYNVSKLRRNYQEDIVTMFLKLLETEKMYVVNQERMDYDNFVTNIRLEVQNEANLGIRRYNRVRKELQRITKVLRKVEEIKTRLFKEMERTSTITGGTSQLEKEHLVDSEIEDAKVRLEESQAESDNVEKKISKLHDQIHQFTTEYHKMAIEGKREIDYNLKDISDLQTQVAAQERKLLMLKHRIQENEQAKAC